MHSYLIIETIGRNGFLTMASTEEIDEIALEIVAEALDELLGVLSDNMHLANVRFGLYVALEAVRVAALLLTDLAIPTKPLKAFLLHLVADPFACPSLRARHLGNFFAWCVWIVDRMQWCRG
jgi:hypothetical protein